jgi:hypothetical protein
MKQTRAIFYAVFVLSLIVQLATKYLEPLPDSNIWADQIHYFLHNDPRQFDFSAAYGHPGGTLVALGSLLHRCFGAPCPDALIISVSFIVAGGAAASAALCYRLHPQTLWWLSTAIILNFNRLSIYATPPTECAMTLVVLIVLAACWRWEQPADRSGAWFFFWGGGMGMLAATRLEIALLVGGPLLLLSLYRHGRRAFFPALAGSLVCFFLADPYLWFMPGQHLRDLVYKFTLHHDQYRHQVAIQWTEYLHAFPWALVSIIWTLQLLARRRLTGLVPTPVICLLLGMLATALLAVLSSDFQAVRYFYPLLIVWEILLPLLLFARFSPAGSFVPTASGRRLVASSRAILAYLLISQVATSSITFAILARIIAHWYPSPLQ